MKEFENESKDFYKDDYENVVTIESKNHRDYQFEAEFSTERIAQIITTTSNEVFGIQEGETGEIVTALGNYKMIASDLYDKIADNDIRKKWFGIDAVALWHPVLGISSGVGLSYLL